MRKILLFLSLSLFFTIYSFSQESKTGTIVVYGKEYNLRFIEVDETLYINWEDLITALPGWFIIENGKINISNELMMLLINGLSNKQYPNSSTDKSVIESRIDGEFEGWDGETIFKLQNGQIWQQDEYAYTYTYKYNPKVTIIKSSRGWIMQVEGMSKTIRVKQLK